MRPIVWNSYVWARIAAVTAATALAAFLIGQNAALLQTWAPIDVATARVTEQILIWLGMAPQREMSILASPGGFAYQIGFACTGLLPAGLLASAILAGRAPLKNKMYGMVAGIVGMLILNQIRLASLFYVGVHWPWLFELAHKWIWQGLTVAYLLGFFCAWLSRTRKQPNFSEETRGIEHSSQWA